MELRMLKQVLVDDLGPQTILEEELALRRVGGLIGIPAIRTRYRREKGSFVVVEMIIDQTVLPLLAGDVVDEETGVAIDTMAEGEAGPGRPWAEEDTGVRVQGEMPMMNCLCLVVCPTKCPIYRSL